MKHDDKVTFVAEEIFEIRYKPKGAFLGSIGELADYIESEGVFSYWDIDQNIINFRDSVSEPKQLSGFLSYRNAGYVCFDAPTQNYFSDKTIAFWKAVDKNPYFKIPEIQRIGIRKRCFVKSDKPFEHIEEKVFSSLFQLDISQKIGGKRKDLQIVFELIENDKKIRLIIGPLHEDEAKKHFRFPSEHFNKCGLYIDIDVYIDEKAHAKQPSVLIKDLSDASWKKIDVITNLLGL